LLISAFIAFWFYNQKRKAAFRHQVLETEIKALRSQMNPHFTFNVLNSIQYYVSENDLDAAELYLEKFSSLIRMILDQSRSTYISLEQEITMLRLYLELEEMRFEKKFNYAITVDPALKIHDILLPGMLIQPIVENAIKHGIRHKEGEAFINVEFTLKNAALLCHVTDNGVGRAEAAKLKSATGHKSAATSITKERMEALGSLYHIRLTYKTEDLYDREGVATGTRVSVEMPYISDDGNGKTMEG
jgi:LytS/YehU family sensor histidine kinase